MTGSPTVNTYAPVFLVWIPHSTQMSGSPTVNTQVFIFLVCVPYSTDDWVPCSKYTCSYFSRQYTHVPIFEAVSSGSPTVHRRLGPLRSIHRCSYFWGSLVWVPPQYTDDWSPAVNTRMFLFLRQSRLGPLTVHRRLGPGLPYSRYTQVPISEAVSSGATAIHRRLGSPTVNTQMSLFLRQSRLGPLQHTDVWVPYSTQMSGSPTVHRRLGPGLPYSRYTDVPISEGSASGTLQRRCLHVVFRRSAIPRPRWTWWSFSGRSPCRAKGSPPPRQGKTGALRQTHQALSVN